MSKVLYQRIVQEKFKLLFFSFNTKNFDSLTYLIGQTTNNNLLFFYKIEDLNGLIGYPVYVLQLVFIPGRDFK